MTSSTFPLPPRRESGLRTSVAARLDDVRWTHVTGPYQALDLRFGVRTTDPALGEYLAAIFADLAVEGTEDGVSWFSVLRRGVSGGGGFVAYLGGRRLVATSAPTLVLAYVLWSLNREAVVSARGAIMIHAAAAERDGVVVVLPGPQGAGKTTLVTALLHRGYRYVTDEVFALDVASGRLRPFAKPLSLEPGSWSLFPTLLPRLTPAQKAYVGAQRHVPASGLGAGTARADAHIRALLRLRYEPGASASLTRLSPSQGLVLLAENSFNTQDWGQHGLCAAADMIRGCTVIGELTVGDVEAGCDVVDAALDQENARGGLRVDDSVHGGGSPGVDGFDAMFVPKAREGVAAVMLESEAVLLDGHTSAMHVLNQTGALVWVCMDGRHSLAQIVADLARKCSADPEVVRRDVVQLVCELDNHDLLDRTPPARALLAPPSAVHVPGEVHESNESRR